MFLFYYKLCDEDTRSVNDNANSGSTKQNEMKGDVIKHANNRLNVFDDDDDDDDA